MENKSSIYMGRTVTVRPPLFKFRKTYGRNCLVTATSGGGMSFHYKKEMNDNYGTEVSK